MVCRWVCHNSRSNNQNDMAELNHQYYQYIVTPLFRGATGATGSTGAVGPQGERGEIGPKGATGATGLTGATGPKGDTGPRGDIGPQGEPGERGEKGDAGEKGPQGEIGPKGDTGERGEKGETGADGKQGATGPQGEPGVISNQNATILSMAGQDLVIGNPITMSTILTNNGLIIGGTSITVPVTGTYIVTFYVNRASSAAGTDGISIAIDGKTIAYTSRPLSEESTSSGYFVMNLDEGNAISLVPVIINAKRLEASGGASATLTVIRIS